MPDLSIVIVIVSLIVLVGFLLVLTLGLMRAAGNVTRLEERWAKERAIQQQMALERQVIEATHGGMRADPDKWDFEANRPKPRT